MEAAASGLSKKPHFLVPEPASGIQQTPSKSRSNTLCKALLVIVLLLVIPLFPSHAPGFISQSILTEFWEILHLLFIGIAVSYGLLCRKSAQVDPERIVHSRNDDSHSYLSGISHLSSLFEGEFENMCGPDEQVMTHIYANYCHCLQKSGGQFLVQDKCVVHGGKKIRSFMSNDVSENTVEGNGKTVNQTWRSQYLKGEPFVVVSNGNYSLDASSEFRPLNLPVRSLKSSIVDDEKTELKYRRGFNPKIDVKSNDKLKVQKIRVMVPMDSQPKFEESAGPSLIPWRSNSGRVGPREEMNTSKPHAHWRPHSVGEIEFEHIKSRSFLGPKFSSSPELESSNVENVGNEKVFSVLRSKVTPLNVEPLLSHKCGEDDKIGKGKQAVGYLEPDMKSSAVAKALSKAKSVRTIKPRRDIVDEMEQGSSQIDRKLGRMRNKFEADSLVKRGSAEESESPPVDNQNHGLDCVYPMPNPKPTLADFHDEEKEGVDDRNVTQFEEETESEPDKNPGEDNARTNLEIDTELEGSEVDRKADEFIAKFREQIWLQKISSQKDTVAGQN